MKLRKDLRKQQCRKLSLAISHIKSRTLFNFGGRRFAALLAASSGHADYTITESITSYKQNHSKHFTYKNCGSFCQKWERVFIKNVDY